MDHSSQQPLEERTGRGVLAKQLILCLCFLSQYPQASFLLLPDSRGRGGGGAADGACFQDLLSQSTSHRSGKQKSLADQNIVHIEPNIQGKGLGS